MENGETLISCLAYVDLNPVRAGIVERPEQYRWCSLGYNVQTKNKDALLSLDFGLKEFGTHGIRSDVTSEFQGTSVETPEERLKFYRRFVYKKGGIERWGEKSQEEETLDITIVGRFRYRTRYFADSGIIGSKQFVRRFYGVFKGHFSSKHEKKPKPIGGLGGISLLKRLYGGG